MKFVTFNIRCDYSQDGVNNFEFRAPFILRKLKQEKPDIICFQEVLPHVAKWLKTCLNDYYVIGCSRSEILDDEQLTIAYRKDTLNLITMDTFWLSETPYVPGSRYEDQSICPRVCTEAVFEEINEKKLFRVVNLHLDHLGATAREQGIRQILKKVQKDSSVWNVPAVLTGDFNAEPNSPELNDLQKDSQYMHITKDIGVTYHGYGNKKGEGHIDDIYIQKPLTCLRTEKWQDCENGVWLSDHYPVCAVLEWKEI